MKFEEKESSVWEGEGEEAFQTKVKKLFILNLHPHFNQLSYVQRKEKLINISCDAIKPKNLSQQGKI